LGCSRNAIQALAKEAKRKQEEEKSRLEEMKRQEKKALEEADAARFKGKEATPPP
jgi:F0F1-type ATP synthase epsilon subunit